MQPLRFRKLPELFWRSALALAACAAATSLSLSGCSTQQCRDMKGSGSAFGSLVCGAEGSEAPEPDAPKPNACTDLRLVMPGFFKLLDDRKLTGLRDTVATIGQPQCLVAEKDRRCTEDSQCQIGDCRAGLCACVRAFNPLGDLLVVTFKGLATIAGDKSEPGAVAGRCVSTTAAASLPEAQINRMCEVRRTLDVLLQQNGGNKLLDDPAVISVVTTFLHYVEGKDYPAPHYDLFTTLGKMAANPGVCAPADIYDLLDKALLYLGTKVTPDSPTTAVIVLGHLQDLLADPQTMQALASLGGSNGDPAKNRAAVVTLLKSLLPGVLAAHSGAEALQPINNLVKQLVYDSGSFTQPFKDKLKAVLDDAGNLLSPAAAVFPDVQRLLGCMSDPAVDPDGQLLGAIYDLLTLNPTPTNPGIDLPTLLGALKTIATLDSTGQVPRTLRLIIRGLAGDEGATEAVRSLLAETLTPEVGQKLIPALDAMVSAKVLGEVISLLDDLLYSCKPPAH